MADSSARSPMERCRDSSEAVEPARPDHYGFELERAFFPGDRRDVHRFTTPSAHLEAIESFASNAASQRMQADMLDQEVLDELWLFDDPAASEARFRVELESGGPWDATERQELTTQLARAIGLQGKFDEAASLLIDIPDDADPLVGVRVLLESGRIMVDSGHPDVAAQLFRKAAEVSSRMGAEFLRIDALHMLAIVDSPRTEDWTEQAVELAEASSSDRTRRWLVTLHSNLGWNRLEGGDPEAALAEFVEAARWAELVGTEEQRQWTLEAIDECTAAIAASSD